MREGSITVARDGVASRVTLVLAGIHGDEPKGVYVALRLLNLLRDEPDIARDRAWVIVPRVNPDGLARRRRRNANLVDINRNFPTNNWTLGDRRSRMFGGERPVSEPETRAVIRCIERFCPSGIVTIHSIDGGRECNNFDGPAAAWARAMSRRNGYPAVASIGYPTPGSFGAWAGVERRIPTITLELPSRASRERCWRDNREALLFPAS